MSATVRSYVRPVLLGAGGWPFFMAVSLPSSLLRHHFHGNATAAAADRRLSGHSRHAVWPDASDSAVVFNFKVNVKVNVLASSQCQNWPMIGSSITHPSIVHI